MALLLDTSAAIALLDAVDAVKNRRDQNDAPFLSVVSLVELTADLFVNGELNDERVQRLGVFLEQVEELPFGSAEVDAYQRIIGATGFSRRLIVDRMIAATALANDLALATLNPRDFRGIAGLTIEGWSA